MSIPEEHLKALGGNLLGEPPKPPAPEPEPEPEPQPDPRDAMIEELRQQNRELSRKMDQQAGLVAKMVDQTSERPVQRTEAAEPDFESMTPAQLARHVMESVKEGHDAIRRDLGFEIVRMRLEGQLTSLHESDPEGFEKHSEDIVRIVKEKGGKVTPAEALAIAKSQAAPVAPKEETPPPAPRRVASTGTVPGRSTARQAPAPVKTSREAATRAYENIFGRKAR
jgi:hypothetical protein